MRSRYKFIEKETIHFVTCTIVEWLPVFTHEKYFRLVIRSLKFCQDHKELEIHAYIILDNHIHLVMSGPNVAQVIGSFKKFTARQIINQLKEDNKKWLLTELAFYKKRYKTKSDYQVWQEGSHPQLISSDRMLLQKIEYIHYNPVKRGPIDKPEHWRYGSARNYLVDDHSVIKVNRLTL